jgi:DNA-binding XRE family transcriptional regulator
MSLGVAGERFGRQKLIELPYLFNKIKIMLTTLSFKKSVGWNIKKFRLGLNVSQDDLSARCGIYRTYLSRIEGGRANPSLLVLVALAATLDVGVGDLLRKDAGTMTISNARSSNRTLSR